MVRFWGGLASKEAFFCVSEDVSEDDSQFENNIVVFSPGNHIYVCTGSFASNLGRTWWHAGDAETLLKI